MAIRELCRTLIVDDEMLIRQGIKHYINWEEEGFQIIGEASNGQEALKLIEITKPHIILTDIVMPFMGGEELTRIVKTKYPHIEIIILSSFGEFEYVRSTFQSGVVDYILKPKLNSQELLNVLKKAVNRIPFFHLKENKQDMNLSVTHIIDKMISGYEVNYDAQIISKLFPFHSYCLLGIDCSEPTSSEPEELKNYIKEKVEFALSTNLENIVYHSFPSGQNVIVFIINMNKNKLHDVIECMTDIAKLNTKAGFALSNQFSDFSKVGTVFKECLLKLLRYRFYFPNKSILLQEDLPKEESNCDSFNLDWFTSEIKHERFDSAFSYLKDHTDLMSTCFNTEVFEYKSFFGNIIFNITVLLGNMEYDVKELEESKYSYFKMIEESTSAEEVVKNLKHFITEIIECISNKRNQNGNLNMKKLLEYIEKHYSEQLTLTGLANHFHFNPSYLSSYFATHNKEGFIEYLNKIRVEEASKLLIKSTATISEISATVGYSDHSYFCKVYKKIKGLSPSQYRRKMR